MQMKASPRRSSGTIPGSSRRALKGAAAGFLLVVVVLAALAAPALAAASPQRMPANEDAVLRALIKEGRIPRTAGAEVQQAMLRTYLQDRLGPKQEDGVAAGYAGNIALKGRTSWGRAIALDPGVTKDHALVILVEFDDHDYTSPDFPGVFPAGPLHGEIPAPSAADNATFWPGPGDKGFGAQHYQDMLFGKQYPIYDESGKLRGTSADTMQNYYLEMSKGAYQVTGQISDWVRVPYPEAWYGRDDADGNGNATGPEWRIAVDAVKALQKAHPDFDWTVYDQKNPYGIAGDDPNVPDGYVDHLILVHEGVDESAGGGAQGVDAIWAHSGVVDSANGLGPAQQGGYQVDSTSSAARPEGIWIGRYTINPEDGGIGIFCHEFGHDLGLPDEYDSSYEGDSESAYWTLMAAGSWLGHKWGLGTKPAPMNAWDKAALGFITPTTVEVGQSADITLPPAAKAQADRAAVKIALPKEQRDVVLSGADDTHNPEFWSGRGDSLTNTWVVWDKAAGEPLDVVVPASGGSLTFDSWYEIEDDYDFGFVQVSTDAGKTWTSLAGDHTIDAGQGNPALSGASGGGVAGTDDPVWETETYSLADYAAMTVWLRFRYATDGGLAYRGWEVTNVRLPGASGPVTVGGADTGYLDPDTPWQSLSGVFSAEYARYYIAEYRDRSGFDAALNAVYAAKTVDAVSFYPYNTGLHLIYRDTYWQDNQVGVHPGEGGWLVVDAHPVPDMKSGVEPWNGRVQSRDAAFSTSPTRTLSLAPWRGSPENLVLAGRLAQPVFDDSQLWWFDWAPDCGAKLDQLGVTIEVKGTTKAGLKIHVHGADPAKG
jgi:immune inhibitor A